MPVFSQQQKGHYVVVRCSTRQEAERWRRALETHTVEDFASQYVQPWPIPTNPALLRDTLIVDIGSASVRAGVLASQGKLDISACTNTQKNLACSSFVYQYNEIA